MSPEDRAKAYCASIGADPDEIVVGFRRYRDGFLHRDRKPRWQWYVGAELPRPRTCPRQTFIKLVD